MTRDISDIPLSYPLAEHPFEEPGGWTDCPVCGGRWRAATGSRLRCHARCLFTPEDQDRLLDYSEPPDPHSISEIAEETGLKVGIVRATLRAAVKRRTARRREHG